MRETGSLRSIADVQVLGSSCCSCVMFDWDDVDYADVKYWSFAVYGWFHLWEFMILRSSPDHYHTVFDRPVDWVTNIHAMAWAAEQSGFPEGLCRYLVMQIIKGSSTLSGWVRRVSSCVRGLFSGTGVRTMRIRRIWRCVGWLGV